MRAAVIGSGAWGTALAISLCRTGHDVTLWVHRADRVPQMETTRRNPRLPGAALPDSMKITSDPACAADCDLVVVASP